MPIAIYVAVAAAIVAAALLLLLWRRSRARDLVGGPLSDRAIENARAQSGQSRGPSDTNGLRNGGTL